MPISKVVFGTNVLIDITDTTATEDQVLSGYVIHKADGSKVTGVAAANILNSDGESIEDDTLIINDGSGGVSWETEYDDTVYIVSDNPNYIAINNYTDPILADEVYRVTFDGVTYTFTTVYNSEIGYYFGNPGVFDQSMDDGSGADFIFYKRTSSQLVGCTTQGSKTIFLKIEKQIGGGSSISLQSKTVTPTTSQQSVTPDSGYDGLSSVTVNAMPSGSASTPATSITANPTITVSSSGLITAAASASQSVTPSVTAGYVASGTAGTITVSGSNTQQLNTQAATTITPTTSSQTAVAAGKYTTGAVTVGAIPSQYIVPSGTKSITANGTGIDVTAYASVDVNVPTGGGSTKNIQAYHGYGETNSTSYTATSVSLTVAKSGTYKVSWTGWRSNGSGSWGSQLYIGNTAYGSAVTTFTRTYGQYVELNNVSLTQGQTITVRAKSRGSSYYMVVANLIIEEV